MQNIENNVPIGREWLDKLQHIHTKDYTAVKKKKKRMRRLSGFIEHKFQHAPSEKKSKDKPLRIGVPIVAQQKQI